MTQIIKLGTLNPGDTLNLINTSPRALKYDIAFGSAGAVSFTLITGAQFSITAGDIAPHIVSDDAAKPGIHLVTDEFGAEPQP